MICQEYKDFACVAELGKYKEDFFIITDHYAEDLNDKIVMDGNVYTLHDFNNHCIDIFKIISEVLLEPKRAYGVDGLTDKELYILDLAVLFHDISMSRDLMTERSNHSKKSAEHVQSLYNDTESLFYKKSGLNINEIKALKAIILAHSDVKDGTVSLEKRGLKDPVLTDKMPAKRGFIRARLLAGILRLADELDITSERLGTVNIEENLKKAQKKCADMELQIKSGEAEQLQEKYREYKKYVESLSHWENLHLFSQVLRESQDDTIYLVADDEHLQYLIDEGNTSAALARRLLKVYGKVKKELEEIKRIAVEDAPNKLDIKSFFPVSKLEIRCDIDTICKELDKQLINVTMVREVTGQEFSVNDSVKDKTGEKAESPKNKTVCGVQLIDKNLSDKLANEIRRRHLLKVGHFLLDDIFCARDWIDTKEIVETKLISEKVVGCFIEHIKKTCDLEKKHVIVGLDLEGALLASRLAMGLKFPFSYIIPVREYPNFSLKELEVSVKEYDGIILITDVVVTFDTIKKALNELIISNGIEREQLLKKITKIYSVFYRESTLIDLNENIDLQKKTFCVNMDFPIELFKKEECHYIKDGDCLALNNRLKSV